MDRILRNDPTKYWFQDLLSTKEDTQLVEEFLAGRPTVELWLLFLWGLILISL
ncbi:hypothetical protein ACLOAV_005188 [Pseudogymnoascus australis]